MGDSSTALLMGKVFNMLARHSDRDIIAMLLWKEMAKVDGADHEMECDEALIKLGLAKEGPEGVMYLSRTKKGKYEY